MTVYVAQVWSWTWPTHVCGFGALLGSLAVFGCVIIILRVVMSECRGRLTKKLQHLNIAAVAFSLLRLSYYNIASLFSELTFTFAICRRPSVCRLSVCRLSVVCNVGAPYLDDWNFRQCFYAVWYVRHLLTSR